MCSLPMQDWIAKIWMTCHHVPATDHCLFVAKRNLDIETHLRIAEKDKYGHSNDDFNLVSNGDWRVLSSCKTLVWTSCCNLLLHCCIGQRSLLLLVKMLKTCGLPVYLLQYSKLLQKDKQLILWAGKMPARLLLRRAGAKSSQAQQQSIAGAR